MELVGITNLKADLSDGQIGELEKLRSLGHSIADEKFLRRLSHGFPENLSKVAAVQVAASGQVGHCNFSHIIIFNKRKGFTDIEI